MRFLPAKWCLILLLAWCGEVLAAPADEASSALCVAGAVIDGQSVDCGGRVLSLQGMNGVRGCAGDREGQPALLSLKNGALVRNLRVAAGGGGHGITCLAGDCTLDGVVWEEVCEHAAGHEAEGGTFTILNSTAYQLLDAAPEHGGKPDKIFQVNAGNAHLVVRDFTVVMIAGESGMRKAGKIVRSCGDCLRNRGGRVIEVDGLTVRHVDRQGRRLPGSGLGSVAGINVRWDASLPEADAIPDRVVLRRLRLQDYRPAQPAVCVAYVGSRIHDASRKLGERWATASCDVRPEDIEAF